MANESEKSEDKCPVGQPIADELHEMMTRFAAELIVNRAEKDLDAALAHVGAHMLRWMVGMVFELTEHNAVQTAENLLKLREMAAADEGIKINTGVHVAASQNTETIQ